MTQPSQADALQRFSKDHISWAAGIRTTPFVLASLVLLLGYSYLLPDPAESSVLVVRTHLVAFSLFLLGWCANVLADSNRGEVVKMAVAFFLIFMFGNLFYRYSGADWAKLQHFFFNFPIMKGSWGVLFKGLGTTIILAISSFFSCILLGLGIAVIRRFNNPTVNLFITAYVDVFRSIPVIVLMVVLFFACPFLGIYLDSFLTTFTSLTLCYGAYTAETFRAGMESVSHGQVEAARSLGLSRWRTITKIVIPQAVPLVIPVLTGNIIAMIKDTAIASIVATPELLKSARELYTAKTSPTPLICAALIFLAVLLPLVRIVNLMEKRFGNCGTNN